MGLFKNIRLGIEFLILATTPPYLAYDFHRLADGEGTLLHRVLLAMICCAAGAWILWLFRQRGMDYARLKILWEWPAALMMLILSAPLLLITSLLIRLESPGPALYSQERVGKNGRKKDRRQTPDNAVHYPPWARRKSDRRRHDLGGRPFIMYKLRSMEMNAEGRTGAAWSTGDYDPRVTKLGYYTRKTHIDELPQLYNVFLGQMSIIGPRPERPAFVAQLNKVIEHYQERLNVPPGITGLAQVRRESDESLDDVKKKLQHDREYIQNLCLWLDVRIILQTIALIFNLFWEALKRRTTRKAEPKAAARLLPGSAPMERP